MRFALCKGGGDEEAENKGSVWVVLVFGRAKWTSIKGEMGLSARKLGLD